MEKILAQVAIFGMWTICGVFMLGFVVCLLNANTWYSVHQKCGDAESDPKKRFELFTAKERRLARRAINGTYEWGSFAGRSFLSVHAYKVGSLYQTWCMVAGILGFIAAIGAAIITVSYWRFL